MIVGSFPIGKFSNPKRRQEIKPHEYDFFFGGEKNLLWKLLGEVFHRKIKSKKDIIDMLEDEGLAIGDVIKSCKRKNGGGSDADLYDIEWNEDLLSIIRQNKIKKIYFTGKKVEAWFGRLFKNTEDLSLHSLISPSAQSLRSLPRREDFQLWLKKCRDRSKMDFILEQYRREFRSKG